MGSSFVLGCALGLVGLIGYLGTGRKSPTALIPLVFGIVFIGLNYAGGPGSLAGKVALGLAALGAAATARALLSIVQGNRSAAVSSKAAMAALCIGYLITELS